jgi:hypothetical protein
LIRYFICNLLISLLFLLREDVFLELPFPLKSVNIE